MIQPLEALAAQQMRQAVTALLQFAISDGLARTGHDEGRFVTILDGM